MTEGPFPADQVDHIWKRHMLGGWASLKGFLDKEARIQTRERTVSRIMKTFTECRVRGVKTQLRAVRTTYAED
jgi:hypothetical protein